jgi:hypothetical protein
MVYDGPVGREETSMSLSDEQLKALKAFKKKLKVYRLDDESSMGGGPMSAGRSSAICGITPPGGFPPALWDELVAAGRLTKVESSMYMLTPPAAPPKSA